MGQTPTRTFLASHLPSTWGTCQYLGTQPMRCCSCQSCGENPTQSTIWFDSTSPPTPSASPLSTCTPAWVNNPQPRATHEYRRNCLASPTTRRPCLPPTNQPTAGFPYDGHHGHAEAQVARPLKQPAAYAGAREAVHGKAKMSWSNFTVHIPCAYNPLTLTFGFPNRVARPQERRPTHAHPSTFSLYSK